MKKGTWGAFREIEVIKKDKLPEKVESLSCSGDAIYVGTAQGNLIQYDIPFSATSAEDFAGSVKQRAAVRLATKKPVEQVHASDNLVFALADGALSILPADLQKTTSGQVLAKEVKRFCLHTGVAQEGQSRPHEVCVCFKKNLRLYAHTGKAFEVRQEFPINEAASALVWHQGWIVLGERRQYMIYSDRAGVPREISSFDGKFAPQIVVLPNNELMLLLQENAGMFYNLGLQQPGASRKNPVTWPRRLVNLGAAGNYVFGSTGNGQVDVWGIRDQKNCQTLSLEGTTVAMAAAGGRLLVATEANGGCTITCLDPIPFERQVQQLLAQVRVSDALSLLNANFGPEDPKREDHLNRFHAQAGWALFRDLQFFQAFQHFLYAADLNVARVLIFWRKYLPAGWDVVGASRPPAGKPQPDDKAPDACDIDDFVRTTLEERQGGSSSSASVSANVDMANATMASFLLKQRDALRNQERLPPEQRMTSLIGANTDLHQMLRAVDTVILKLLIEADTDDLRLQEVLGVGVHCTIEDCEQFLRDHQRLDVLAKLWKARGLYDLVLEEWSHFLSGGGEIKASGASAKKGLTRAEAVLEMVDALRGAANTSGGADLVRKYVPELLGVDPAAVLPVFTHAGQCALSVDEVLKLFENNLAMDLVLGYLEYAAESHKADVHHMAKLGLMYVKQVEDLEESRKQGSTVAAAEQAAVRKKLLNFVETTKDLDVHELLPKVVELGLHQECVVLYSKAHQDLEALRMLVVDLDDLPRAEIYCRIIMARLNNLPAASAAATTDSGVATSSPEELSVLCPEPPDWARGLAFGAKRSKGSSSDPQDEDAMHATADAQAENLADPSGPKPLMLFLKVLLDISAAATETKGRFRHAASHYQEAAITLLTAYAGHSDLPVYEVMDILPSGWTLASLSSYLSRSARTCLHEKRASMLEENLSSMAYLKTYDIWAKERKRKVHITGDRCCPVCNRRFVDKDSVGKAFVAYPNETCVHVQCQDDISICPKTGRNFADNIPVSCHALGM